MLALACYDKLRGVTLLAAAGVLLLAGCVKLSDFRAGRPTEGLLATAPPAVLPIVASAEISLAVCIVLLGDRIPAIQYSTATAYLMLAAAAAWGLLIHAESCGCFGWFRVPPWVMLLGDLGVALALFALPPVGRGTTLIAPAAQHVASPALIRGVALCLALLALALVHPRASLAVRALGFHIPIPLAGTATRYLVPEQWLGKEFPLAGETGIADEIACGEWVVLFYHQGCPSCERARRALLATSQRVVVIEVAPSEAAGGAGSAIPDAWLFRALDGTQNWLVETPVILELTDGVVRAVRRTQESRT